CGAPAKLTEGGKVPLEELVIGKIGGDISPPPEAEKFHRIPHPHPSPLPDGEGVHSAVSLTNLTKRFGDFTAVDKISLSVPKGEIFGFLGPNGAGKSTTIRMLCGILPPTSGRGQVAGFDISTQPELIKKNI